MDSLTHVVLGGSIQAALLGRTQGRKALLYGAVLATLPDLDVLASYPDPVSLMTHHRGFTHSIFVLTGLALVLAWLIRRRCPNAPYGAGRLFLTLWLVLITHPLMDALTSYGTQLFWPIPVPPTAVSSVFIIDPIFTAPLLVAFLASLAWSERARSGRTVALAWAAIYVAWTLSAKAIVERHVDQALAEQGIRVVERFSTPMPLNSLLWRVIVLTPDGDYYETVAGVLDRNPPEHLRQPLNLDLRAAIASSPLRSRLEWFTQGWLRYDAIDGNLVVTDLRMGIPGHYTFRFVMARRDAAGHWQRVVPTRWPSPRGTWDQFKQTLRRTVDSQPPLPLAQWALAATAR